MLLCSSSSFPSSGLGLCLWKHSPQAESKGSNDQKVELRFTWSCWCVPVRRSSDQENISFCFFQAPGLALDKTRFVLTASNLQLQVEKKKEKKHPVVRRRSHVLLVLFGSLLQRRSRRRGEICSMSRSEVSQDNKQGEASDLVPSSRRLQRQGRKPQLVFHADVSTVSGCGPERAVFRCL